MENLPDFKKFDRVEFTGKAWLQFPTIKQGAHKATVVSTPTSTTVRVLRDGLKSVNTYHRKYWKLSK